MRTRLFLVVALATAVALGTLLSPYAAASPDGLERVAIDNGFGDAGRTAAIQESSPIADYAFPGIGDQRVATALAGFAGTLALFALAYGVALAARRVRTGRA